MTGNAVPGQVAPDTGAGRARTAVRPVLYCAVLTLLAVAADAGSKAWAVSRLSGGRDITLAGGVLRLRLVVNHGASLGLGAGAEPLLAVVAFVALILFGTWAVRAGRRGQRTGTALAAAGTAGNLIDRLFRSPSVLHGGVVDWLHVSFYGPTFNLADIWLRGGLLIALVSAIWPRVTPRATGTAIVPD